MMADGQEMLYLLRISVKCFWVEIIQKKMNHHFMRKNTKNTNFVLRRRTQKKPQLWSSQDQLHSERSMVSGPQPHHFSFPWIQSFFCEGVTAILSLVPNTPTQDLVGPNRQANHISKLSVEYKSRQIRSPNKLVREFFSHTTLMSPHVLPKTNNQRLICEGDTYLCFKLQFLCSFIW